MLLAAGFDQRAFFGSGFPPFPNPANNEITIEWDGFDVKRGSAQIVGSLGQLLRKIPIQDGSTSLTTSVADLPEGIYFVKILSGRRTLKVLKFIKL
ncbi:MAG: T9SS type A sorting domain-containing protein [Saprospirales bacterium]|nr:T9SS type A sorting domain-containing protein [Saprospirales bacterium]